jgi:pimeloyl-ACP methyl ester carboxylesterase
VREVGAAGSELSGAVQYPFLVGGDLLASVEGMHRAIADRSFDAVGLAGAPVRVVHDGIAATVYGALGVVARACGQGAGRAALLLPPPAQELSASPAGGRLVAALNGAAGDRLAASGSGAAIRMAVRAGDRDVPATRPGLAAAFPSAGGRLAVFVHGLFGTEHSWDARGGSDSVGHGAGLEADLGYTPVFVRYNSGLHVSQNGRALAALLEEARGVWPVPVREIALIGHSMGGLVARSACHYGEVSGHRWASAVPHVVCLGSPHLGAPVEKAANAVGHVLRVAPESRPLAQLWNRRSVGIKDLRFGSLVDEDWLGRDPDAFLEDTCREVPFLEGAAYSFVGVTVTRDAQHPLGRLVGDLLVRLPSASGQGRRRRVPFEVGRGRHLGGLTHLDLLRRREVYEQLRGLLQG